MFKNNDEIISAYLLWFKSGHTKASVNSYSDGLRNFRNWLIQEGLFILDLSLTNINRYQQFLENRGIKDGTRAHYTVVLKSMWGWLYKQGLVKWKPDLILLPEYTRERRETLEEHEFDTLISIYNEAFPKDLRNKLIICFLYATGLRLGEFLEITLDDLDLKDRSVRVKTYKRKNHYRTVFWDSQTNDLLLKWIAIRENIVENSPTPALFVSLDNVSYAKPIQRCVVQRIFRHARKKTGLKKKISPHSCRHGFATKAVRRNINLPYLKEMLGHANINNTMIYVHQNDSHLRDEYNKIFESKR